MYGRRPSNRNLGVHRLIGCFLPSGFQTIYLLLTKLKVNPGLTSCKKYTNGYGFCLCLETKLDMYKVCKVFFDRITKSSKKMNDN